MVPGDLTPGSHSKAATRPIDLGDRIAMDKFDLLLGIELRWPQPQIIDPGFPGEIGFRQGRPLVGQDRLVANQHDAAVKPLLAQRGGGLKPALAGADNGGDRSRHQTWVSGR